MKPSHVTIERHEWIEVREAGNCFHVLTRHSESLDCVDSGSTSVQLPDAGHTVVKWNRALPHAVVELPDSQHTVVGMPDSKTGQ